MSNFSLFCCCLILFISHAVSGDELIIEPTWPSCENYASSIRNDIRPIFINNIASNTVLKLKPGCHYIDSFVPIQDQTNVTIEGIGETPSDVVIFCGQNTVGLVFLGIRGLTLQNLSISNCGLTGDHLNQTIGVIEKDYVPNFQSIFTYNSSTLHIAMLLVKSSDVTMTSVNVVHNTGYGILAVNVKSSFVIESCKFKYNSNELYGPCFSSVDYGIGGGILILYQDNIIKGAADNSSTQFLVSNTEFMYNTNCQLDSTNFIFSSIVELSEQRLDSHPISSGGGMTVYLANLLYPVEVNVKDCYLQNNTALAGGGILIGVFVGASNNTINIMDSIFYQNGLLLKFEVETRTLGQGLLILKDIPFPFSVASPPSGSIAFTIKNCYFQENVATSMAAAGFVSLYLISGFYFEPDEVRFNNCTFVGNQAFATSALLLQEYKRNGFQPGTQFYLTDLTFIKNDVLTTHFMLSAKITDRFNTLGVSGVAIFMNGTNKFISNYLGTPISLIDSILHVSGDLQIIENSGNTGGGLALIMSYIVISRNTYLLFQNNSAFLQAGAIFMYTSNPMLDFDCYLFFEVIATHCYDFGSKLCPDPRQMNITVVFDNNIAPISNVAYGSTLYDCPWRQPLNDSCCDSLPNITDTYRLLQAADVFSFTPALEEGDSLSTPPVRLTTNLTSSKPVMLGQQVIVEVLSYDGFNQLVPDPVSSVVFDNLVYGKQDSRLGDGNYWFVNGNKFSQVPVSVWSKDPLAQANVNIGIYSITSTAGNRFDISITDCFPGFEFQSLNENTTNHQYKTCECLEIFDRLGISCFKENATIIVPNGYWLGQVGDNWVYERCPFDYCKQGDKVIENGQFDDQCNDGYHRRDVLCGRCEAHYSAQLGRNECNKCSLFWSIGSMVYFAFFGFILISCIGKLSISVSYGYINSLIFFSNIAYQFLSIILLDSNSVFRVLLFYPIDVLNGGIGFQTCIFSGMTALYKHYIQFIFPLYLYIILGIHVIVIRYFKSARKWIANPSQVFATIILMTYISLLESSIYGLSFTYIEYQGVNGSTGGELTWSADSNVKYFSLEHAPLAIISLVFLLLYLLPSTILLLFPSLAFRTPIGKKLIPIYDAYWAPFKDQFKFWIGLRLILRIIPLVLAGYVPRPYNIFCLQIFIIAYTFAHIIVRPFIREVQNFLDIYMNYCLLLLISGSSYSNSEFVDANNIKGFAVLYNVLTICLIYFAIFFVVSHHLYMKVKCLRELLNRGKHFGKRMYNKVTNNVTNSDDQKSNRQSIAESSYSEMSTTIDDDVSSGEFNLKELHKNRRSSSSLQLREPLLDEELFNANAHKFLRGIIN